jgi:beta-lactamase regulating signal transducer with metallopeptidase domain
MHLLFWQQAFSDEIINAICWTLLHSLWQGLLAAAVAGIIIMSTNRSSSLLRYNLLTFVFFLFAAGTAITFARQLQLSNESAYYATTASSPYTNRAIYQTPVVAPTNNSAVYTSTYFDQFSGYFNSHTTIVFLVWCIFFIIQCIKLVAGLSYVNRIRNYKIYEPDNHWKAKVKSLCKDLGITRPLLLLQSEIVKIPVVVGFLKPVILVPIGLLSHLSPGQVETILLHELAHIRRKDYLVNLLQSITETFFFFNPAVLWLSSLIREEREACCDDIVMKHTTNKRGYLEALVSFQEHNLASHGYAMALGGKRAYLYNRVKRMVTNENKKLNNMEKAILVLGVLSITAFGFISKKEASVKNITSVSAKTTIIAQPSEDNVGNKKENRNLFLFTEFNKVKDTVPKPVTPSQKGETNVYRFPKIITNTVDDGKGKTQQVIATDDKGTIYKIRKTEGQVTEFSVNDRDIPKEKYGEYLSVMDAVEAKQRANAEKEGQQRAIESKASRQEKQKEIQELKASQQARQEEMQQRAQVDYERKQLAIEKHHAHAEAALRQKEIQAVEEKIQKKGQLGKENYKSIEKNHKLAEESYNKAEAALKRKEVKMQHASQAKIHNQQAEIEAAQSKMYKDQLHQSPDHSNSEVNAIINELMDKKIITDKSSLSFTLNDHELIVNGKTLDANFHQKLKAKYINKPGDFFTYNRQGGSTSTTIHRE